MSSTDDAVQNVLAELGAAIGSELALEDGVLTLAFTDEVACTIELPPEAERLCLHAPVLRLPPEQGEAVLRAALVRNLFTLTPPGGFLALDPKSDELRLCAVLPVAALDVESLGATLLALGEEVRELRLTLLEGAGADPSLHELADEMRAGRVDATRRKLVGIETDLVLPHGLAGIGVRG